MATWYLDPENGVDANAGTSFATRRKTLTALTAANLAPGDEIRYIASHAPTSLGSCTWTNGSRTVTLPAPATLLIENGSAWTASTNVTCTTSSTRAHGANSASIGITLNFSTGKVAYKTLGAALDLSAYQQISFLCRSNAAGPNVGSLELRLCSDTTGDVAVHTIPLVDAPLAVSAFRAYVKDFGAALSSSIQSLSIWANADPGTVTLIVNNIVACKAKSAADSLTHVSLFKKDSDPAWFPICGLDGTTVAIGGAHDVGLASTTSTPRNYNGTTESAATSKFQPLDGVNGTSTPALASASRILQDAGAVGNLITISGGWNRTDMSTQTGETWLSGANWAGAAINCNNKGFLRVENIGFAAFSNTPLDLGSVGGPFELDILGYVGVSGTPFNLTQASTGGLTADIGYFNACSGASNFGGYEVQGDTVVNVGRFQNFYGTTSHNLMQIGANGAGHSTVVTCPIADNFPGTVVQFQGFSSGRAMLRDTVVTNADSTDILRVNGNAGTNNFLVNCTPIGLTSYSTTDSCAVTCVKQGGDADNNVTLWRSASFSSQTTVRHTASGVAWKLSPQATVYNQHRYCIPPEPLARYNAAAGVPVTFKCWVRRTNTGLTCGIRTRAGTVAGVGTTEAAMTAAADTWEELSLTVTPTEAGLIELWPWAYGGTTYSAYFDDVTVEV
jgi:hypothetical protein